ncbi:MAG TPA: 2TM domain-containing protein [Bacteroidia bacterium]|jgi:hypothetical protein
MEEKDQRLWRMAKKRAAFKRHLATYIIINGFLWALWYISGDRDEMRHERFPWPAWCSLGWGVGLAFDFISTYMGGGKYSLAEREYEKLLKKKNNGM